MKAFVRGCLRFMEHLGLTTAQVEATVREQTNQLLERLSGTLKSFVLNPRLSLIQLIQITINMGYLEKSCEVCLPPLLSLLPPTLLNFDQALESFISKLTSGEEGEAAGGGGGAHLVHLKEDIFRDARSEVEQRIDVALAAKVREFLDLAHYDWERSGGSSGRASDYISDLVAFLGTTFSSFTNLPPLLARHTCLQACKFLASTLHERLRDPEVCAHSDREAKWIIGLGDR